MSLLRDADRPAAAGSSPTAASRDAHRLRDTIDSYDHCAAVYADRLSRADLGPYLARFRDRLPTGAVVLDGGCGGGRDVRWMSEHGLEPIGLDLSVGMLAEARLAVPDATFLHGDLRDIPLADGSVDGVWLCASMLHLAPADALTALQEARRVLTFGGVVFVSTAAGYGSEWRATELGRRWFQLYTEPQLADLMTQAGLRVMERVTEPGVVQGQWVNITAERRD